MSKKVTHEDYVNRLIQANINIRPVEKFVNMKTNILHHCLTHDVYWEAAPTNILAGKGCPECKMEKIKNALRKTHEEYVADLKIANPNIIVLEEYKGGDVKILHRCLIHNVDWEAYPNNVLKGEGCHLCGVDKIRAKTAKTHEEYVNMLKIANPTVEVVDRYINSKTKIKHRCLIHNIEWDVTPSNVLNGHGCPQCHKDRIGESNGITHEEYVERLRLVSSNIQVIGKYQTMRTPILHKCLSHDLIWDAVPENVLKGCGCKLCGSEKISESNTLTQDDFVAKAKFINPNVEILGEYVSAKEPILCKCLIHNQEYITAPTVVLMGCGCPQCKSEKTSTAVRKTHEEYVNQLHLVAPDITVIEKYIDSSTPILHECKVCGNQWKAIPTYILSGSGCPQCSSSRGEKEVRNYLEEYSIAYERQKRFDGCIDKRCLPFDFYLPDYNVAIEYDGVQHYKPIDYFGGEESFKILQKHDVIKNDYCNNNNIRLLRISYMQDVKTELDNFLFAS